MLQTVIKVELKETFVYDLFSFLHNEPYDVTFVSCQKEQIQVKYENDVFTISLFNLKMKEDKGWEKTCQILKDAKQLTIEVDASTAIQEPLPVYIFADEQLLQETLVRNQDAYTIIHNPEYKYEKQLLALEETTQVMAEPSSETTANSSMLQSWLFIVFLFVCWLCFILYALWKHKKISFSHTRKS